MSRSRVTAWQQVPDREACAMLLAAGLPSQAACTESVLGTRRTRGALRGRQRRWEEALRGVHVRVWARALACGRLRRERGLGADGGRRLRLGLAGPAARCRLGRSCASPTGSEPRFVSPQHSHTEHAAAGAPAAATEPSSQRHRPSPRRCSSCDSSV